MSLFRHRRRDEVHSPWSGAPDWGREIGEQNAVIICQNEAILAKLEERASKLSPADQAIMDEIFKTATATTAKIDAELRPNPANPEPPPDTDGVARGK